MSKEEDVKRAFFPVLKNCIDTIITQDENRCYSEDPYIDIEAIAKGCGITNIRRISSKGILDKHAFLVEKDIYVNEEDNPEKQRFAIAHEIFHFMTNWPIRDSMQAVARQGEAWKQQNAGSLEAMSEVVADYFAANLLIPTEYFILWEDKADEEIAKAFGVEPKCIKKRREEIGYELDMMAPQSLSSDVNSENLAPLSHDELDAILEAHSTCDGKGRT